MSDMKTYLEQNACDRESILTRSVKEPKSWDEVATAIKSAIFDYLDLNRDVIKDTNYLYVGIESLWDDPHKDAVRFHLGIPVLPIRESFISLPTRYFDEEYLVPNSKRLIMMLQRSGFDKPTMSSGVTVFVAEVNFAEIKKKELAQKSEDNVPKWIFCDQQLPKPNERVVLLVVELDHGQKPTDPDANWCIDTDFGSYHPDMSGVYGNWTTDNDWDEGQPWAVVAWATIPKPLPKPDITNHTIEWFNA